MIMNEGDLWSKRRVNAMGDVWDKLGISYDDILEGFPKRAPFPVNGAQRYRYAQVNSFRLELRFRMRSREEDGKFWERRLA